MRSCEPWWCWAWRRAIKFVEMDAWVLAMLARRQNGIWSAVDSPAGSRRQAVFRRPTFVWEGGVSIPTFVYFPHMSFKTGLGFVFYTTSGSGVCGVQEVDHATGLPICIGVSHKADVTELPTHRVKTPRRRETKRSLISFDVLRETTLSAPNDRSK